MHRIDVQVTMDALQMSPRTLVEMVKLIADEVISGKIAKDLLPELLKGAAESQGVAAFVEERGMSQLSDAAAIEALIQSVMDQNPKQLADYRAGKTKLQGYFQGQAMKESGGRVNPSMLAKILPKMLQG